VLAAGRGERFGPESKLLRELAGVPIVRRAVDAARASGLAPVVVVVPEGRVGDTIGRAVGKGVEVVVNPDPGRGISSSLVVALDALDPRPDVDAVVVGLGDQPLVGAEAYRRVADASTTGATIAVAIYGGERRNPVVLDRSLWPAARALTGDEGARALMRDHPVREVPCDGTGDPADIDRPDDLEELRARCASTTSFE